MKRPDSNREGRSTSVRQPNDRRETASPDRNPPVASLHRAVGNQAVQSLAGRGTREESESGRSQSGEAATDGSTRGMCSRCIRRYRAGKPMNCRECEETLQRSPDEPAASRAEHEGSNQATLAVSDPDDEYEQEAERVAQEVLRSPDVEPATTESPIQRSTSPSSGGATVSEDFERKVQSVRTGGMPLPESLRSYFEPRFGRDFSDVRVHTGPRADEVARSINAEAFTLGRDIVFSDGSYRPNTNEGKELLAHELTHVVQQRAAEASRKQLRIGDPDDRFETEAERIATRVTRADSEPADQATVSVVHSTAQPRVQGILSWITCPYYTWKYSATINECSEEIKPYCGAKGSIEDCLAKLNEYDASGITEAVFKCAQEKESEALPKTLASCLSLSFGTVLNR